MRSQDQVELVGPDGQQAVVLEVEVHHLAAVHALRFQASHSLVKQVGFSAATDADERHYLAAVQRQLHRPRSRFGQLALSVLGENVFKIFLFHEERMADPFPLLKERKWEAA